jgi:hypothetical protein
VRCGAELGVGRFCLNCGHPIGQPAPAAPVTIAAPPGPAADQAPAPAAPEPMAVPVQAADPTPVPPVARPEPVPDDPEEATATAPVVRRPSRPEWDPREELLPLEEVDELDADDPIRGRAWIAWVVGAAVLVAVVVVLLEVLGGDGGDGDQTAADPATSASSAPADETPEGTEETVPETPEAPQGVGKRLELATAASFAVPGTAPPTTDFDGTLVAYEANQMHDGIPSTTWRTAGDATGQTIMITLAKRAVVSRVGLINGYAKKVAGVDWYPNNRRILSVTWGFENGTTVEQTFAEQPAMQLLKVPPVQTGTITITIGSVTPPGSGPLGRDYTAISEVSITGRRAG